MNKDVNIEIKATIISQQETDRIVTNAKGSFFEKDGYIFVLYDEELEDGKTNKCQLKISEKEMQLKKSGEATVVMHFTREYETNTLYRTPFGVFDFHICTTKLDMFIKEDEVKIRLEYDMGIDSDQVSHHMMNINITDNKNPRQ